MRVLAGCLVLAACVLAASASHASGNRVALVVGISDYLHSPALKNPGNDARKMAAALEASGFDVVRSVDDDLAGLLTALEAFYRKANGAEAALFFFAGHGLQFNGTNYIVPRDAKLRSQWQLKHETVALQDIISALERRAGITLILLDACRDNPLAEELQRSAMGLSRSAAVPRGLARMDIKNPNTLVVFAAKAGRTAADGAGANSPFTTALLNHIHRPGIDVELLMKRVTRDVHQATRGQQTPERVSLLTSEFIFRQRTGSGTGGVAEASGQEWQDIAPDDARDRDGKARLATRDTAAAQPTGTRANVGPPAGCIVIGRNIEAKIPLAVGTQFCDAGGRNTARVNKIANRLVVFRISGESQPLYCPQGQLCGFRWPDRPMFRVEAKADAALGIKPEASMLPR